MRAAFLTEMDSRPTLELAFSATSNPDALQRAEANYAKRCLEGRFLEGAGTLSAMSAAARTSLDAELL